VIILLYGENTYLSSKKLEEIISGYQKKYDSGLNIRFFHQKECFSDLIDYEKQISMFKEKRLLVVKNGLFSEDIKKGIVTNLEKILASENIFIFYEEGKIKKEEKLFKLFLKEKEKEPKSVIVQEFEFLSSKKLYSWIKKQFEEQKREIEEEAVIYLSKMGGNDLWRLKNEIDKLSLSTEKITKENITDLVKIETESNIFKTIDAIAERDKEKALLFLYDHLQKNDSPHYLFSMIIYQFRNIIMVKDLMERGLQYEKMKSKSGLHPFVFSKTYKQAGRFSKEELEKNYQRLFEFDLKIKTGQIDPVLALHLFLFGC
jgi:DNA polymerase-3 subunit delta